MPVMQTSELNNIMSSKIKDRIIHISAFAKILFRVTASLLLFALIDCGKKEDFSKVELQSSVFISTEELHNLSGIKNVTIIDTRSKEDYEVFHIPGALNLPKNSLRTPQDIEYKNRTGFAISPEKAAKVFSALGVRKDTRVIAYDSISYPDASIVWTILNYYGHENVQVLKGGIEKWVTDQYKLDQGSSKAVLPGHFVPVSRDELVANSDWIQKNKDKVVLLDMRTLSEYLGINPAGNKRGGSIPGAIHIEWSELAGNETIKSKEEISAVLSKYKIPRDKTVVPYCNYGIGRSTYGFMIFKILGYENVRVYGGSMEDWAGNEKLPIGNTGNIPKN